MIDIQHEKFAHLIEEAAALEDQIAALEQQHPADAGLTALREQLADVNNRLSRVSAGCGPGRNPAG